LLRDTETYALTDGTAFRGMDCRAAAEADCAAENPGAVGTRRVFVPEGVDLVPGDLLRRESDGRILRVIDGTVIGRPPAGGALRYCVVRAEEVTDR